MNLCIVGVNHLLNLESLQKRFKQTGDCRSIYKAELNRACFQLDMDYIDHKNVDTRTVIKYIIW